MNRILLIDDNMLFCKSLAQTIDWSSIDCEICGIAYNSEDAKKMIQEKQPDIVITDIKMPGMDGLDLTQEIKKSYPDCIIIVITGYQEFQYAQKALRLGVYDILLKPIQNQEVLQTVKSAIDSKGKSSHRTIEEKGYDASDETVQFQHLRELVSEISLLVTQFVPESTEANHKIMEKLDSLNSKAELMDCLDEVLRTFRFDMSKNEKNPFVEKILEYIKTVYNENITLSSVAKLFHVNPSYLSRLIKAETNQNFTDLLLDYRIKKAKEFLRTTEWKVSEIAFRVGYKDYTYFYQVFKRMVGISPGEYRKLHGIHDCGENILK